MYYRYDFYNEYGCGYFDKFIEANPEFNNCQFAEYVALNNHGDRDSGELHDIAPFEVLRLASDWMEKQTRFDKMGS